MSGENEPDKSKTAIAVVGLGIVVLVTLLFGSPTCGPGESRISDGRGSYCE